MIQRVTLLLAVCFALPSLVGASTTALSSPQAVGFEENLGQFPRDVLFRGRTREMDVFVHRSDLRVALPVSGRKDATHDFVHLAFDDAHMAPRIQPQQELPGKTNYFRMDARIDGVRTFARLALHELYEHVDLELYASGSQIEFDLIVRPGGDPASIRMTTAPARAKRDRAGNLLVRGKTGATLRVKAPHIYQVIGGKQRQVAGAFAIRADGSIGFSVGIYDPTIALVIDPTFEYATYVDGSGRESVTDVFTDSLENRYITGTTDSNTNFPPAGVPKHGSRQGTYVDAFVAKYNRAGALVFVTIIGGTDNDRAYTVHADDGGFVYVAGTTRDQGFGAAWKFPTTPGAYRSPFPTEGTIGVAVWVMKLNPTGSISFSALLGGSYMSIPRGIGVDRAGNIYVGGEGWSATPPQQPFPTTPGAYSRTSKDVLDALLFRLNPTGTTLLSSTFFGGSGQETVSGFDVEPDGTMWIGGRTSSADLPTTTGAYQATAIGPSEAFIARVSADCRRVLYASYLRSTDASTDGTDRVRTLVVDKEGSLYVGGLTESEHFPITEGAYGTQDGRGFIMKFDATLALQFAARMPLEVVAIAVDGGAVVAVGSVHEYEPAIPTVSPTQPARGGQDDVFVMRLNPAGSALEFSTYLGGSGSEAATAVAMSPNGNATVVGESSSTNFPVTADAAQPTAFPITEGGGNGVVLPDRGFVATYVFDLDRDGLLDIWETNGIDINGDGTVDLSLPGATPDHKDIFVELDYMAVTGTGNHTHDPRRTSSGTVLAVNPMQSVTDAFASAPVSNPDGTTGIRLHVVLDEEIPEQTPLVWGTNGTGFDALKRGVPPGPCTGRFGTAAQRSSANCANILRAKKLAYRYAISAHSFGKSFSGVAELGGNDFVVSLSTGPSQSHEARAQAFASTYGTSLAEEWGDMIAGTFMHELGHTLNLDHGGGLGIDAADRSVGCKPNHLSVMNYTRQFNSGGAFPGTPSPVRLGRALDFSRSALPDLEELALHEGLGISGPAGHLIGFGRNGILRVAASEDPIDWNGANGIDASPVGVDINYIRALYMCGPNYGQALVGHDDWANLTYSFRASPDFRDGATLADTAPELTDEDLSALVRGSVPPRVAVTAPAPDARVAAYAPLTISATVTVGDNAVMAVEFFADDTFLGTDSTTPYSYTWNSPAEGTHALRVRATDSLDVSSSTFTAVHIGCMPTLTPSSATFGPSGGSGSITITHPPTCTWSVATTFEWLIASASAGVGPATLTYDALANSTTSARTGSITINDATFTVTEAGAVPFSAPTGLVATALRDEALRPYINISWQAVAEATHYDVSVQRAGTTSSITTTEPSLVLHPNGTVSGAAYLFKVRAVNAAGTQSAYSAPDIATVVFFTHDPIVPPVTTAKVLHVTELRTAVDAVRALAGLSAATWTSIQVGAPIRAAVIVELRSALDAARSTLALPVVSYTDPTVGAGTRIKAVHVQDLRGGTK
jgi:hypothetical protein